MHCRTYYSVYHGRNISHIGVPSDILHLPELNICQDWTYYQVPKHAGTRQSSLSYFFTGLVAHRTIQCAPSHIYHCYLHLLRPHSIQPICRFVHSILQSCWEYCLAIYFVLFSVHFAACSSSWRVYQGTGQIYVALQSWINRMNTACLL
jgi:hypothetical protein